MSSALEYFIKQVCRLRAVFVPYFLSAQAKYLSMKKHGFAFFVLNSVRCTVCDRESKDQTP